MTVLDLTKPSDFSSRVDALLESTTQRISTHDARAFGPCSRRNLPCGPKDENPDAAEVAPGARSAYRPQPVRGKRSHWRGACGRLGLSAGRSSLRANATCRASPSRLFLQARLVQKSLLFVPDKPHLFKTKSGAAAPGERTQLPSRPSKWARVSPNEAPVVDKCGKADRHPFA
jgi:hypothetical protein